MSLTSAYPSRPIHAMDSANARVSTLGTGKNDVKDEEAVYTIALHEAAYARTVGNLSD